MLSNSLSLFSLPFDAVQSEVLRMSLNKETKNIYLLRPMEVLCSEVW